MGFSGEQYEHGNKPSVYIKDEKYFDRLSVYELFKNDSIGSSETVTLFSHALNCVLCVRFAGVRGKDTNLRAVLDVTNTKKQCLALNCGTEMSSLSRSVFVLNAILAS